MTYNEYIAKIKEIDELLNKMNRERFENQTNGVLAYDTSASEHAIAELRVVQNLYNNKLMSLLSEKVDKMSDEEINKLFIEKQKDIFKRDYLNLQHIKNNCSYNMKTALNRIKVPSDNLDEIQETANIVKREEKEIIPTTLLMCNPTYVKMLSTIATEREKDNSIRYSKDLEIAFREYYQGIESYIQKYKTITEPVALEYANKVFSKVIQNPSNDKVLANFKDKTSDLNSPITVEEIFRNSGYTSGDHLGITNYMTTNGLKRYQEIQHEAKMILLMNTSLYKRS